MNVSRNKRHHTSFPGFIGMKKNCKQNWDKVLKNGPNTICERQPLKILPREYFVSTI